MTLSAGEFGEIIKGMREAFTRGDNTDVLVPRGNAARRERPGCAGREYGDAAFGNLELPGDANYNDTHG